MRTACAALLIALAGGTIDTARADPYQWCAVLGGSDDLSTGCYYVTLQQCQASISGNGGFCTPNNFYDGRPRLTAEDGVRRGRSRVR